MVRDHGNWTVYAPEALPSGLTLEVLFCRNEKGKDWYVFQKTLKKNTVKATLYEGKVLVATRDASKLFPQKCRLVEIDDSTTDDPQTKYVGKTFEELV
jgi:hypothetical protein